jgi:hypothetical protein
MGITDERGAGLYFKRIVSLAPRFGGKAALQRRWLALAAEAEAATTARTVDRRVPAHR